MYVNFEIIYGIFFLHVIICIYNIFTFGIVKKKKKRKIPDHCMSIIKAKMGWVEKLG